VDMKLELIVVPVSDVDRAKAFYAEKAGFTVDVDHRAGESFRVVQLTPPGSACSITIGVGLSTVAPGTYQGLHLVVDDIEAAHAELRGRGLDISDPFHFGAEGQTAGFHPERSDYGSYLSFSDPDGNGWLVQEVGHNRS
jgi:catechol 2,3-dioxygenase-like lactoylglutathione lyase family enzyme